MRNRYSVHSKTVLTDYVQDFGKIFVPFVIREAQVVSDEIHS